MEIEPRLGRVARDRLLYEDHPVIPRETPHQMLRTLVDEMPPKVRKADQGATRPEMRPGGFGDWSGPAVPAPGTILFDIDLIRSGPAHSALSAFLAGPVGVARPVHAPLPKPGPNKREQRVRVPTPDCSIDPTVARNLRQTISASSRGYACSGELSRASGAFSLPS